MNFLKIIRDGFLGYANKWAKLGAGAVTAVEEQTDDYRLLTKIALWHGGSTIGLLLLGLISLAFGILSIFLSDWQVVIPFWVMTVFSLATGFIMLVRQNKKKLSEEWVIPGMALRITGIVMFVPAVLMVYFLITRGQAGAPQIFLGTAIVPLLLSYLMLCVFSTAFKAAVLTAVLAKNLVIDSHIQLIKNAWGVVTNVGKWSSKTIKTTSRIVAAAIPGLQLAEVEAAMKEVGEKATGENLFKAAKKTAEELTQEAFKLFAGISKFYLFLIACSVVLFLADLLLNFGRNQTTYLNNPVFILITLIVLAAGTYLFFKKLIKIIVITLLVIIAVIVVDYHSGHFLKQTPETVRATLAKIVEEYFLKEAASNFDAMALKEVRNLVTPRFNHSAYIFMEYDSTKLIPLDKLERGVDVIAGERWRLIDTTVYAVANRNDRIRLIHVRTGHGNEMRDCFGELTAWRGILAKDMESPSGLQLPKKDNGFPLPLTFLSTKPVAPDIWEVILPANVGNGKTGVKIPAKARFSVVVSGTTNPAGLSSTLDGANQDTDARGIDASWRGRRTSVISWPYDNTRAPNNLGVVAYRLNENSLWSGVYSGSDMVSYSDQEETLYLANNDDFTDDNGNFRPDFYDDNSGHYVVQVKIEIN